MNKKVTLPFDFEIVKVAKHLGHEATKYSSNNRRFLRICATEATPDATYAIIATKTVSTTARSWHDIARTFVYIADPNNPDFVYNDDPDMVYLMVLDPGPSVHRVEAMTREEYESRLTGMTVFTAPLTEIELDVKHGVN